MKASCASATGASGSSGDRINTILKALNIEFLIVCPNLDLSPCVNAESTEDNIYPQEAVPEAEGTARERQIQWEGKHEGQWGHRQCKGSDNSGVHSEGTRIIDLSCIALSCPWVQSLQQELDVTLQALADVTAKLTCTETKQQEALDDLEDLREVIMMQEAALQSIQAKLEAQMSVMEHTASSSKQEQDVTMMSHPLYKELRTSRCKAQHAQRMVEEI